MGDNRLLELIAKKQSGEISPLELIELNKLIRNDPANGEFPGLLEKLWETPLETQDLPPSYAKERFNSLKERFSANTAFVGPEPAEPFSRKNKTIKLYKYAAVAACFVLTAGAATWWMTQNKTTDQPAHNNVVSTKKGSNSLVTLPDGTEVWLNAGSNLTYNNETFGKGSRELQLEGEAFFDVAKDPTRPFIIHTKTMDVKVLGTTFNVRAYPDEKTTEASLLEGSIEISLAKRPSDRILLKPSEKISVRNDELQLTANDQTASPKQTDNTVSRPAITVSNISYDPVDSTVIEASWVKNKLIFRNKPFEEVARDMERRYDVTIIINNKELLPKRFTGTFYNESVLEALSKLQVSYPFQFRYNKETTTVTIE